MRGKAKFNEGPNADDIEFARAPYPSKYDDLIDKTARLGHKKTLVVPLEDGDTQESRRQCVRQALNRYLPDATKEIKRYVVRKGANGKVVIVCFHRSRERG